MSETPYDTKCDILGEFWLDNKGNPDYEDFISYNDIGLPLAYAISIGIVKSTDRARGFITETFTMLLSELNIESDTGFETLEDLYILDQE
jgi:hypothetical protein